MHGTVIVTHPDISEEERERRYQHMIDVVIEETKKMLLAKSDQK